MILQTRDYEYTCNFSGTVTSTKGTEMRNIGPVLKERGKNSQGSVEGWEKARGLGVKLRKYQCVQGSGQERKRV